MIQEETTPGRPSNKLATKTNICSQAVNVIGRLWSRLGRQLQRAAWVTLLWLMSSDSRSGHTLTQASRLGGLPLPWLMWRPDPAVVYTFFTKKSLYKWYVIIVRTKIMLHIYEPVLHPRCKIYLQLVQCSRITCNHLVYCFYFALRAQFIYFNKFLYGYSSSEIYTFLFTVKLQITIFKFFRWETYLNKQFIFTDSA